MVGASSNVYVSLTASHSNDGGEHEGYRRAQHTWLISVEPHKHYVPFAPRHKLVPHHFTATRVGPEAYRVHAYTTDNIIGTLLIAEGTHFSTDDLQKALTDGLGSESTSASLPSESNEDEEPEEWITKGLHLLQNRGITDKFDVSNFVTFARSYVAQREDSQGPAMIAYPGLHKEPEKKNKKNGFWLSYPTQTHSKGDPDSQLYGGLI